MKGPRAKGLNSICNAFRACQRKVKISFSWKLKWAVKKFNYFMYCPWGIFWFPVLKHPNLHFPLPILDRKIFKGRFFAIWDVTILKGELSSYKSVTGILPNNPTRLQPFSSFINFPPKLGDSCSGVIIRLERSQCYN